MLLWSAFNFEGKISSCLYSIYSIILVQCPPSQVPWNDYKIVPLQALLHNVYDREIRYSVKIHHVQSIKRAVQPYQHMLQDIFPFFSCPSEFI